LSCGPLDHWCTDVSWIRRIPTCNAAALLHNNIRNDQLLHRGCTVWFTVKPPRIQIITPQLVLLLELHYQSARVLHRGPKYYTTKAPKTTQLRMLPQPTTPRLQLITPPKLSNTTQERPSTIEISRVSFSDTQHGSPEVSNKLRFKQWNGKQ
jgi:hypothetical protein